MVDSGATTRRPHGPGAKKTSSSHYSEVRIRLLPLAPGQRPPCRETGGRPTLGSQSDVVNPNQFPEPLAVPTTKNTKYPVVDHVETVSPLRRRTDHSY